MKRERAKKLLPIIQAYVEGKQIQFLSRRQQENGEWLDVWYDCLEPDGPSFFEQTEYRIKPNEPVEVETSEGKAYLANGAEIPIEKSSYVL